MQGQAIHFPAGHVHQDFRPVVIHPVGAAGDGVDMIAGIVFNKRAVPAEIIGVKLRPHITAATPAFVSYAEIVELPRFIPAVLPSQVRQRGIRIAGDIFHPVHHFLRGSATDVAADIRLGPDLLAEIEKLVRAELVGFNHPAPVRIDAPGPLVARPDPIPPMVFIRKTSPRPAKHRNIKVFQRRDHVIANSTRIGDRRILPNPNPLINAAAKMLRKLAVNIAVDCWPRLVRVNGEMSRDRLLRLGHGVATYRGRAKCHK